MKHVARTVIVLSLLSSAASAQAGTAAFDEGVRLMRLNKPDAAERQFERAIAADERNGTYHLWLGRAVGQQASTASTLRQPFMARRIKSEFDPGGLLNPGRFPVDVSP